MSLGSAHWGRQRGAIGGGSALFSLLFSVFVGLFSLEAFATPGQPPLFNCNLSFKIEGQAAFLAPDGTSAQGAGRLSCYDYVTGAVEDIPLRVTVNGRGLGAGLSGSELAGGQVGLGIPGRPETLLGQYDRDPAVGSAGGDEIRLGFRRDGIEITSHINRAGSLGGSFEITSLRLAKDDLRRASRTTGTPSSEVARPTVMAPEAPARVSGEASVATELPVENLVLKTQGAEVILVNAQGTPVKRLKIFLLQK